MHLQHTCFYEIILHSCITADHFFADKSTCNLYLLSEHRSGHIRQAANNLLLAREHSPDVNNKPIIIPYLEQGYCWIGLSTLCRHNFEHNSEAKASSIMLE